MCFQTKYNIAIVGGGIGGLMAAYRLAEQNPGLSICLMEKGRDIRERLCPIVTGKVKKCIKCEPCAIMEGLAGAGAFSDGKYVISTEYGGWLTDFLAPDVVLDYIEQADGILTRHGATTERFQPNDELKRLCLEQDLHMQQAQIKHLGTDANFETMVRLIDSLRNRADIHTLTEVTDVDKERHTVTARDAEGTHTFTADTIIFAVGRAGSGFFSNWCNKNGIPLKNNQVDIGVRVELPAMVWEHFSQKIYEPKVLYRSKQYGDTTRMFCFNERGKVVTENTNGILTATPTAAGRKRQKIPTLPCSPPSALPSPLIPPSSMPGMWPSWPT